jgi:hypothetical protein
LSVHGRLIVGEVFGSDGAKCRPEVVEEVKGRAETKFCDGIFEIGEIFFGAVSCDHQDEDDFELNVGVVFVLVNDK